jgi:hypothetical protein
MPVLGDEHAPERGRGAMRVGERVDGAMLHDPVTDAAREALAQRALHEIAGEVADQRLRVVASQEEMCQVVHVRASTHVIGLVTGW